MTHIAVIGAGPGGYVAALRAAQLGAQVTLIEREQVGGTCLNAGCIPTKALLHTAEYLDAVTGAAACGVTLEASLDFAQAQRHKEGVVGQLVAGVKGLLRAAGVELIGGSAAFIDASTLAITAADGTVRELTFDKALIATGSINATPPLPGIDAPQCIDSTGALALEAVPESLLIIGGGVIGVEMATIYASMGARVTIVEMMEEILPSADREMARLVRADLEQRGVRILTGATVLSVEDRGALASVAVELAGERANGLANEPAVAGASESAVERCTFEAEKVLVSVGRRPQTEALALEAAGVACERGRILVNERQETSVPGIYALGDCTGGAMLAHVASAQGEVAAENACATAVATSSASSQPAAGSASSHAATENACGKPVVYRGATVPSCVYTNPELAGVGFTEEQLKAAGQPYRVGRFPLAANGKTLIMGGTGLVKILAAERHGEVLGLHLYGPRATDLIAEGALAIELEATLDELIATIHAHPTVSEAVREAALAAEHRALHIPNR